MESENTTEPEIVMYGADWCGDCIRAKSFFDERDIAFAYVDLVAHPEFMAAVIDRNQGARRIPVIVFPDGSHLTEPSNTELAAKLDELQNGSSSPGPLSGQASRKPAST